MQQMPDGVDRMGKNHPGASKPHDFLYFSPVIRRIAVDGAFGTGWLVLSIWAVIKPAVCIPQQITAVRAILRVAVMDFFAV